MNKYSKQGSLGDVLTRIRADLGKTQAEFAVFLGIAGVNGSTVSKWERDLYKPTRARRLKVLEKISQHITPEEAKLIG